MDLSIIEKEKAYVGVLKKNSTIRFSGKSDINTTHRYRKTGIAIL